MWKRFDNDVKRKTHVFEGIFIDPFDNDNPSDHPLNFAFGVMTTSAIKESLRKTLGSQVSINFTKKHLIPSENNMPLKSYYHSLPKSDIKVMTKMQNDSPHPIQQSNNQERSNVFKVRKDAKIRKRPNQEPHLIKDATWESNKNTTKITNKSQ